MRYIIFSFLLILSLLISQIIAQTNTVFFQHFTSDQGLTQNGISCINQDEDGYLWFGTYNGINKFDGHTCKTISTFTRDSNKTFPLHPETFLKDNKGRMWVSNGREILRYDELTGKFIDITNNKIYQTKIGAFDITSLAEDESGNIWIGTRGGLIKFDETNNNFTKYNHDTVGNKSYVYSKNRITYLIPDKHGTIWVGTLSGLFKFSINTHEFISVFKTEDDPNSYKDHILTMTFDKKGSIWIAVDNYGIRVIDTTTNYITYLNTKTTNNQLNSNDIQDLLCDKNSNMWIAHNTKGINIYYPDSKRFESYFHDESDIQSLIDDRPSTLFLDKNGMVWIGTQNEGVDAVSTIPQKFNTYIQHPGNPNTLCENGITCCAEDKSGNLWMGSQRGVIYFDRKKNFFTCFHPSDNDNNSISNDHILAIEFDNQGFLWVGTLKGLNRYDPSTGKWKRYFFDKKETKSIPSDIVDGICELKNGELWMATNAGPCRYHPDGDWFESNTNSEIIRKFKPDYYINIFEDSRKTIWLSTSRSGIYHIDESFNILHYYYVSEKKNSLPGNCVMDFDEDKNGNIWMATSEGLCKLDFKTQEFTTYTNANGLSSNYINQIIVDKQGTVWVGTSTGLSQLIFDSNGKVTIKNFDVSDGLQSNAFYTSSSLKLKSGELFFGGSKGFNLFQPENIKFNTLIPQIQISSFSVFDKEFDYLSQYNATKTIKLDYKQNFFSFDMAAMSFDHPEKNQYAYELEGFDKEMIYCGTRHHVSYTNVPPGVYTLHIIASNNDGVWNMDGLRVQIEITPPFWKTWWFRIVFVLILLIIFTLLIRYISTRKLKKKIAIIEQQRKIENIRSRISRDMHDEIGSGLTRISLLSELIKSNINDKEKETSLLNKISKSSREIAGNLSEIIWTVNPEHDNLKSLLSYMRHFINMLFEDSNISYKINFPEEFDNISIHPDIKRNLFLVLKESLNNIFKHAKAKSVSITFVIKGKDYEFIIVDDGIGMENLNSNEFGNGLRNMRSRINSINASIDIISEKGKGTTISIKGKLDSI